MGTLRRAAVAALLLAASGLSPLSAGANAAETAAATAEEGNIYRFTVGTMEAIGLDDGRMRVPNDNSLMAVGRTREESAALLTAAGLPGNTLDLPIRPLLLRNGERTILFDAGAGAAMGSGFGKLPASMRAAGIEPSAVTDVMISHGHPDHVAGLLGADEAPAFPNATIRIPEPEWAAIGADPAMAELVEAIAPKVETFRTGATLAPGVRAVAIQGHTPGHTGYEIVSGEDRLLYFGDTLIHPVISIQRPEWRTMADGDSPAAIASRIALLSRASNEGLRLYGVHFPFPSVGHIQRREDAFVWVPVAPAP